jgi:hypothetical protein
VNPVSDTDILRFFRFHLHPMLVHLYMEARLEVPVKFDYKIEGPRLVAALREQGFSTKFPAIDEPASSTRVKKSNKSS